jgi:Cys-tRNA(Pro) deacylase
MAGKIPSSPALRLLRRAGVEHQVHPYAYTPRGGTSHSSRELGVDEHLVIKTLVFEADGEVVVVLMHGDRKVSAKQLARELGVKSARPCKPDVAERHSGYRVGGTSPFGLRRPLPIYAETSIFDLARIYINAGARGYLVCLSPDVLERLLEPQRVRVAEPG